MRGHFRWHSSRIQSILSWCVSIGSHTAWLKVPSISLHVIVACMATSVRLSRLSTCPRSWNRWACLPAPKRPTAIKASLMGEGSTAPVVLLLAVPLGWTKSSRAYLKYVDYVFVQTKMKIALHFVQLWCPLKDTRNNERGLPVLSLSFGSSFCGFQSCWEILWSFELIKHAQLLSFNLFWPGIVVHWSYGNTMMYLMFFFLHLLCDYLSQCHHVVFFIQICLSP